MKAYRCKISRYMTGSDYREKESVPIVVKPSVIDEV